MDFIQDILEEIDGDGLEEKESQDCTEDKTHSGESIEFEELVLQVLEAMKEDEGLEPLHGYIKKCEEQVQELCDKLGFISACKPLQGIKNTPSSKEKAWGKFHDSLVSNLIEITSITGNTQLTSFLCLMLFERMLAPPPVYEPSSTPNETYSKEELDIICYIGGSIVSKVKKFSKRLQVKEQAQYLNVISYLVATEESGVENTGLIDCYDRGGLTRIKPQVFHMFVTMEDIFVSMFNQATVLSVNAFIRKCGEHDDILCGFYETVYESETEDSVKEHIVKRMLEIYFTVRVHQKCRVYMDQVRNKTRVSKKQKALRQKLKT